MTAPTPTPPCLGEREAVARTDEACSCCGLTIEECSERYMLGIEAKEALQADADLWPVLKANFHLMHAKAFEQGYLAGRAKFDPIRTENETLRAELNAATARAEEAERRHEGKFWIELREPGRVPERKGEFPISGMTKILREFMDARPTAFLTVVTIGYTGPDFQHGPEALQMADARSMERGRKHNARVREAHGDHATKTTLAERDTALAKLAQAEGEIATMRRAFFKVAMIQARELQRLDPHGNTPPDLDAAMADLRATLTTPEPPHGD